MNQFITVQNARDPYFREQGLIAHMEHVEIRQRLGQPIVRWKKIRCLQNGWSSWSIVGEVGLCSRIGWGCTERCCIEWWSKLRDSSSRLMLRYRWNNNGCMLRMMIARHLSQITCRIGAGVTANRHTWRDIIFIRLTMKTAEQWGVVTSRTEWWCTAGGSRLRGIEYVASTAHHRPIHGDVTWLLAVSHKCCSSPRWLYPLADE